MSKRTASTSIVQRGMLDQVCGRARGDGGTSKKSRLAVLVLPRPRMIVLFQMCCVAPCRSPTTKIPPRYADQHFFFPRYFPDKPPR